MSYSCSLCLTIGEGMVVYVSNDARAQSSQLAPHPCIGGIACMARSMNRACYAAASCVPCLALPTAMHCVGCLMVNPQRARIQPHTQHSRESAHLAPRVRLGGNAPAAPTPRRWEPFAAMVVHPACNRLRWSVAAVHSVLSECPAPKSACAPRRQQAAYLHADSCIQEVRLEDASLIPELSIKPLKRCKLA
ncbi:hypothetical protein B0H11DRAFT_1908051 [Mycena galericulata]|nr:hypothetical protein B0H11DRAFT_1908051 [Mycena galericulata]